MKNKFETAFKLFDIANSSDPNVEVWEGKEYSKELLYAIRMSKKLNEFQPNASEAVRIAARCQHICRWKVPRESYKMNRLGYLTWRKNLYKFHAEKASKILKKVGYDDNLINKVTSLLQKKQFKRNKETQLLEDVICLVFLENYFEKFSKKYTENKLIDIMQKTWAKMSDKGHKAALKLNLSKESEVLIQKALS